MARDLNWLCSTTAAAITRADTAEVLDVDERTVTRAVEAGQLPSIRVGRRVLIPRLPLLELLGAESSPPVTQPEGEPGGDERGEVRGQGDVGRLRGRGSAPLRPAG